MTDTPESPGVRKLPLAIILPVVLTVVLFFLTIFFIVLPTLSSALMGQRRGLIHQLTEIAVGTLAHYHEMETTGILTRETAQARAIDHLRKLRYGEDHKDYFWINDMVPKIIMHPYRTDLEGQDVSDYKDPNGKRLFVAFVDVVKKQGSGFVDYEWQWKDDPDRIVPKISFVKGFAPWGWVVGTGIYIEDIQAHISQITKKLTLICLSILILMALLSAIIIWQGIMVEKKRTVAERQARVQQEQLYHAGKMATVGTLAAGVAHEINNPVTAILLNAPILKEVWENITPLMEKCAKDNPDLLVGEMDFSELFHRTPRLLDHIEDGARRIRNIVNELKDFARISPPDLTDDVMINHAVEKSVSLVSNLISKSTRNFSMVLRPDLPAVKGNTQKIEQVIINLLVNACQSLADSSASIEITTGYDENRKKVMVKVADEGCGMSPELLVRIKDPFYTTKQDSGNTGLGLAISDRILEDHGATMAFASTIGKGTTVILLFDANTAADTHP